MTPSGTALENCCCLANAKREPVSLSSAHWGGCESERALFGSPPLLHTLLPSHPTPNPLERTGAERFPACPFRTLGCSGKLWKGPHLGRLSTEVLAGGLPLGCPYREGGSGDTVCDMGLPHTKENGLCPVIPEPLWTSIAVKN